MLAVLCRQPYLCPRSPSLPVVWGTMPWLRGRAETQRVWVLSLQMAESREGAAREGLVGADVQEEIDSCADECSFITAQLITH